MISLALGLWAARVRGQPFDIYQVLRTLASLKLLNRSLKSGLTSIATSYRLYLFDHLPHGREAALSADPLPELNFE